MSGCQKTLAYSDRVSVPTLVMCAAASDWLLVRISTLLNIVILLNGVGLGTAKYQQRCDGECSCQGTLLCCFAAEQAAVACIFEDTASQYFVQIRQKLLMQQAGTAGKSLEPY